MSQSKEPLASGLGRDITWFREFVNRLAVLWSSPRIGRVALCSPVVGVVARPGRRCVPAGARFHVHPRAGRLAPLPDASDRGRASPGDHLPLSLVAGGAGPDGRGPDLGVPGLHLGPRGGRARHRRDDPLVPSGWRDRSGRGCRSSRASPRSSQLVRGAPRDRRPIAQVGRLGSLLAGVAETAADRSPAADAGRSRRGRRGDLPGTARRRTFCRRGPLFVHRLRNQRPCCPAWPARSSRIPRSHCS